MNKYLFNFCLELNNFCSSCFNTCLDTHKYLARCSKKKVSYKLKSCKFDSISCYFSTITTIPPITILFLPPFIQPNIIKFINIL